MRSRVGSLAAQTGSAMAQRVRNRQPDGGRTDEGGSPVNGDSLTRWAGFIDRRAANRRAGIGMRRVAVDAIDRAEFDHLAEVHHQHAVGQIMHDIQIVRDEDISQAQHTLDVGQQVQHLGLNRFVQGRDGFIQDQQARIDRDAAGDIDALALPPGHLVRVAVDEQVGIKPDKAQGFHALCGGLSRRAYRARAGRRRSRHRRCGGG